MRARKTIQVFEHETLRVGTRGFDREHFKRLVLFNDKHGGQYLSPGYDNVKFNGYVGVFQVADLTIEVLPKAGREGDKQVWHDALLGMLKASGFLNLRTVSEADLKMHKGSLFDVYIEVFLAHCHALLAEGLIRRYRLKSDNRTALRGRLLFHEQLKRNTVHKERFFTSSQDYTRDNVFNQILLKALGIIAIASGSPVLQKKAVLLRQEMEDISDASFTADSFIRLKYDRTSKRYRDAVNLAELIILNYLPDLQGGGRSVLALMFKMDALFEAYVAALLKKVAGPVSVKISTQRAKHFWRGTAGGLKTIRPDILVDWRDESGTRRVVLDTKWKLPIGNIPADSDLKQMFVYNEYFDSEDSRLVYPATEACGISTGKFVGSRSTSGSLRGQCSMWRIQVINSEQRSLNRNLGREMLAELVGPDPSCVASTGKR